MKTIETIEKMLLEQNMHCDHTHIELLAAIIDENHSIEDFIDFDDEDGDCRQDLIDALETIANGGDDFNLDFDGNEYRVIAEPAIWDIYVAEIQQTVEECYDLKLDTIPSFISWSIDWGQTAHNAYVDGYGHQFSSYDESEIYTTAYYVFRMN